MITFKESKSVPRGFVIPSVSLLGSELVTVSNGRYVPLTSEGERVVPAAIVDELLEHYSRVHLLDLKGMEKDRPQWDVIRKLAEMGPVWVDVGAATGDSVIDIIMAGAEAAVLPLKFLDSLGEVASALELTDNVIIQVDMEERILGPERVNRLRGLGELLEELAVLGVRRVILHDHLNPPAMVRSRFLEGRITKSNFKIYWASKTFQEAEMAHEEGFSGALVSLGDLIER